jgi:hypothetical protein
VAVPLPGVLRDASYCRSNREPMVVLSVEKPQVNMTANANRNTVGVVESVFGAADRACEDGLGWKEVCGVRGGEPSFRKFVKDHRAFVKIEINYWGRSCMKGRALIGWLESRFIGVSVSLLHFRETKISHSLAAAIGSATRQYTHSPCPLMASEVRRWKCLG